MKRLFIASTSTLFGGEYLSYIQEELAIFFKDVSTLLFIPYARPGGMSYDTYLDRARKGFESLSIEVQGIHEFDDPKKAVEEAEAIFTGGGNSFVLVDELYSNELLPIIRTAVERGTPYLGTSAGSNITGVSIQTTNDMPIAYPPSFKALGLVPFNLNPHYLDPDPNSKHNGETRETRIKEFHTYNSEIVIGLREGSWIAVDGSSMVLRGDLSARIFEQGKIPYELPTGSELRDLF